MTGWLRVGWDLERSRGMRQGGRISSSGYCVGAFSQGGLVQAWGLAV